VDRDNEDLLGRLKKKHEDGFDWDVRVSKVTGRPIWSGSSELRALSTQDFAGNFINNFGCGTIFFLFVLLVMWGIDGWVGKGAIILGVVGCGWWLYNEIRGKVFDNEWSVFVTADGFEYRDYKIEDDVVSDVRVGEQWKLEYSDVAKIKFGQTVTYFDQRYFDGDLVRVSDGEWCSLIILKDGSFNTVMFVEKHRLQALALSSSITAYLNYIRWKE